MKKQRVPVVITYIWGDGVLQWKARLLNAKNGCHVFTSSPRKTPSTARGDVRKFIIQAALNEDHPFLYELV